MPRRPGKLFFRCLVAVVPAVGMLAFGTVAANAQTTAAASNPAATARAIAEAAIQKLEVGQRPVGIKKSAAKPGGLTGQPEVESDSWAGYADTGTTFTKVSGHWAEPSVTCSGTATQLIAFWVGLDGYSSDSVEQDGTIAECYSGIEYQYSWWEMYPTNAIQVVGESVAAGDSITASVTRSGTKYTLKVTDATHAANSFSTTQSCSGCANTSAEWILEAPSGSSTSIYPIPDFYTWSTSSDTVTGGGTAGSICSFTYYEIVMVNGSGKVIAQPSPLNSACNAFSVTYE